MAKIVSGYARKARDVAKFVTFKVSAKELPNSSERQRVNKYHRIIYGYRARNGDYIPGLSSGAKFAYKTKSDKLLKSAQEYGGTRHNKFMKVAFVPWDGINKPKLRLRKGKVEDRQEFLTRRIIPFDQELMIDGLTNDNVKDIVEKAVAENGDVKIFNIMAGDQGFEPLEGGLGTASPELIADLVLRYMLQYGDGLEHGADDNHHYSRWLFGLVGYTFNKQSQFFDYQANREALVKMRRRDRRNARRRVNTKKPKKSR